MYHTNRAGGWLRLAVLLSLCTPAPAAVAGEDKAVPARNLAVVDVPDDAELFAAYQSDSSNQKVQTWGQYRGWVQTFYKGNLLSEGWSKFGEVTVSKVKSASTRQAVIAHINELGRIIGLEWAKDSSVRRITTAELRRWNEVMATARQTDDGSGQQIIDALKTVRRMAEPRLPHHTTQPGNCRQPTMSSTGLAPGFLGRALPNYVCLTPAFRLRG